MKTYLFLISLLPNLIFSAAVAFPRVVPPGTLSPLEEARMYARIFGVDTQTLALCDDYPDLISLNQRLIDTINSTYPQIFKYFTITYGSENYLAILSKALLNYGEEYIRMEYPKNVIDYFRGFANERIIYYQLSRLSHSFALNFVDFISSVGKIKRYEYFIKIHPMRMTINLSALGTSSQWFKDAREEFTKEMDKSKAEPGKLFTALNLIIKCAETTSTDISDISYPSEYKTEFRDMFNEVPNLQSLYEKARYMYVHRNMLFFKSKSDIENDLAATFFSTTGNEHILNRFKSLYATICATIMKDTILDILTHYEGNQNYMNDKIMKKGHNHIFYAPEGEGPNIKLSREEYEELKKRVITILGHPEVRSKINLTPTIDFAQQYTYDLLEAGPCEVPGELALNFNPGPLTENTNTEGIGFMLFIGLIIGGFSFLIAALAIKRFKRTSKQLHEDMEHQIKKSKTQDDSSDPQQPPTSPNYLFSTPNPYSNSFSNLHNSQNTFNQHFPSSYYTN